MNLKIFELIKKSEILVITFIIFVFITLQLINISSLQAKHADEALYACTAYYLNKGSVLGLELFSHQPPLIFKILSVFSSNKEELFAYGRICILLFSVGIISIIYMLVRAIYSKTSAMTAILLLATSDVFLRFSSTINAEIPALFFSIASIFILYRFQVSALTLFLTFFLFSLGLLTKLITIPLILPILILLIQKTKFKNTLFNIKNILAVLSGTIIAIVLAFANTDYVKVIQQSIFYHLGETRNINLQSQAYASLNPFIQFLDSQSYIIIFTLFIFIRFKSQSTLLAIWLLASIIFLLIHKPIFYHHFSLLIIPFCILAGEGLKEFYLNFRYKKLLLLILVGIVVCLPLRNFQLISQFKDPSKPEIIELINNNTVENEFIFSENPIFALQSNRNIDPFMCDFSAVRAQSGYVDENILIKNVNSVALFIISDSTLSFYKKLAVELKEKFNLLDCVIYKRKKYSIYKKKI